jgi:hypothetical protein
VSDGKVHVGNAVHPQMLIQQTITQNRAERRNREKNVWLGVEGGGLESL